MPSLAQYLSRIVGDAFAQAGLPREFGAVRVSDRPDLAQFQCNGAMMAAKHPDAGAASGTKRNPRDIAVAVAEILAQRAEIVRAEVAGPGFINIDVDVRLISEILAKFSQSQRFFIDTAQTENKGAKIIFDYGGPNIAKAMHVGHLRSSIIGDALRRMALAAGFDAMGDVHMGDWGLPMGQIISELARRHPDWPYFDDTYSGPYPDQSPVSMEDLEQIYPAAANACKDDPVRMDEARAATLALQDGKPGYRALWRHFIDVSIAGMKRNFDALGVHFDLWKGEADVHDLIAPMVADLTARGVAMESDGALVVPVAEPDDKKEMPPLILYKRDGAVMYGTTDLATIVERVKLYDPARIVYVVDQRQALHFTQVFRAARKSAIAPPDTALIHAGFGTMNGTDGKPFKTRAGGVMKLEDLIAMAVEKARARLAEAEIGADLPAAERDDIAHKVAIAAIKFADLQNNRVADYVFDLDRMTAFEGKTGPYLLYQAVRIKSLLRKAGDGDRVTGDDSDVVTRYLLPVTRIGEADLPLALLLTELPDHFDIAMRHYTPHVLCDHAYKLAQAFSSFYGACHILSEPDAALRASRLALCALTVRQLELLLGLLGIAVPERM